MKKVLFTIAALLISILSIAQDTVAQDTTNGYIQWSDNVKIYWLISIIALSIFLAARTFRNKPEA